MEHADLVTEIDHIRRHVVESLARRGGDECGSPWTWRIGWVSQPIARLTDRDPLTLGDIDLQEVTSRGGHVHRGECALGREVHELF